LDKLKELGIEDNTIVMYSTDNGAETFTWPDGGTTMFRGEKNTNWEGGYRVPALIRWPGTIKPGTIVNDVCAHEDMLTTLLAAAGEPNVAQELLKGKHRRQDLQGPPRRLRPCTCAQRRRRLAAQGIHLLDG
jgi:arylsulfatase